VHWHVDVPISADSSTSQAGDGSRGSDGARTAGLPQAALYAALSVRTADLAARWRIQSRKILLLDAPRNDDHLGPAPDVAPELVNALVAVFAVSDEDSEAAAVSTGLQFGAEAYTRGASLHHTVKALNMLVSMVLHAMQKTAVGSLASEASVGDGVWLAQRLHDRAGLLSLAVIRGYTQAQSDTLRARFRHLRHDLRNPLGTIKSVLALMDDESVPAEARENANFRAMAKRNARALEEMIADRLGDTTVPIPTLIDRDVSVQNVAETVCGGLRREAERRGVAVLIDTTDLRGRFDVPGLELLLQVVLEAALRESRAGERIHLTFDENSKDRVAICLSRKSGHLPIERRNALDRLGVLARGMGASVTFGDPIVVSLPMDAGDRGARTVSKDVTPGDAKGLGVAEKSYNLRSSREDDHGQANIL
jgi:signal transduction histidine kinase